MKPVAHKRNCVICKLEWPVLWDHAIPGFTYFFLILIFKACYTHRCTWAHTQAQAYHAHTFLLGPVLLTASNHKSQVKQLHLKCIMNYALSLKRAKKTYSNLFLIAWGHHYWQQVYASITQWGFLGMQGSLSLSQMVSEMMVFEFPASSLCFFFRLSHYHKSAWL